MTPDERLHWAVLIRSLRKRFALTQEQFAQKIGVSFSTVNRWENGHHEPTLVAMREILRFLNK